MGSNIVIEIEPNTKPRMTRADKWKKRPCVLQYRAFCDELRLHNVRIEPNEMHIIFHISMPDSWSEKKKLSFDKTPHQNKKDIDNLLKAILDCLLDEDKYIYDIRASKYWSRKGKIEFRYGKDLQAQ